MTFSLGIMKDNIGDNKNSDIILYDLTKWSELMSRTHFSRAKSMGAKSLFSYIKTKYGVKKNKRALFRDSAVYTKCELLGDNFEEIDRVLSEIYSYRKRTSASYERRAKCICRIIDHMPYGVTYSKSGRFFVPPRKIKLRDRFIHNPTVYRLGTLLFKKGSKIRAFLKKHL